MSPFQWSFERLNPRCPRRDPVEAEFFTGDPDASEVERRTDTLVRELVQNSMDARLTDQRVEVAFRLPDPGCYDPAQAELGWQCLHALYPHLRVMRDLALPSQTEPITWFAYEDFGTRGLEGDPLRVSDPPPSVDGADDGFYWFWRNIGRSAKSGDNRGRWGLGKTVLPAASRLSTFFGLTRRKSDRQKLLMGQCILKVHEVDGVEYEPVGYFHSRVQQHRDVQAPIADPFFIDQFERVFGLARGNNPGLSLVVPFPLVAMEPVEIVRSVIVHFFIPILQDQLRAVVSRGDENLILERGSLERICRNLKWDGKKSTKRHRSPPVDLARRAMLLRAGGVPILQVDLRALGSKDEVARQAAGQYRSRIRDYFCGPGAVESMAKSSTGGMQEAMLRALTSVRLDKGTWT